MPNQFKAEFSKTFQGNVWQQSLSGHQLLITLRNEEEMTTSFSLLDLSSGEMHFDGLSLEESWWVDVYHFHEQHVIFQVYRDSQDIQSKRYVGFDIVTQEELWSIEDVLALEVRENQVHFLNQLDEGDSFWLFIPTGEVQDEPMEEIDEPDISYPLLSPFHYGEDSAHFKTISQFLTQKAGIDLVGSCEYLEHEGFIFIACHEKQNEGFCLSLLVFDDQGQLLWNQLLDERLKGLASGAFFIVDDRLIFVEGRKTLKSYLIG